MDAKKRIVMDSVFIVSLLSVIVTLDINSRSVGVVFFMLLSLFNSRNFLLGKDIYTPSGVEEPFDERGDVRGSWRFLGWLHILVAVLVLAFHFYGLFF